MSKSGRIVLWCTGILAMLFVLAAVARVALRPQMPSSWRSLHAGMSRAELLATAAGEHHDMRELKGFDVFTSETNMFSARGYWQLLVTYNRAGQPANADARFVYRSCGFFNRVERVF